MSEKKNDDFFEVNERSIRENEARLLLHEWATGLPLPLPTWLEKFEVSDNAVDATLYLTNMACFARDYADDPKSINDACACLIDEKRRIVKKMAAFVAAHIDDGAEPTIHCELQVDWDKDSGEKVTP